MKKVGRAWRTARLLLFLLDVLFAGSLAGAALFNALGPERWWVTAFNLYLPQWYWAVPAALLFGAHLALARRWVWLPLLCLFYIGGPLMGRRWGAGQTAPGAHLRVMTYNVDGDQGGDLIRAEVEAAQPDLVFLQESGTPPWHAGWNCAGFAEKILSKLPLSDVNTPILPASPEWRRYTTASTEVGGRRIALVDLHLDTPREGIFEIRHSGLAGVSLFERNMADRVYKAAGIAQALRSETGPMLVCGDLNAPEPSLVCRTLLHLGLRDAFSQAGHGYGYSYGHRLSVGLHRPFVRIDHILVSRDWAVEACRVGGMEGSDHRPVIADLVLRSP